MIFLIIFFQTKVSACVVVCHPNLLSHAEDTHTNKQAVEKDIHYTQPTLATVHTTFPFHMNFVLLITTSFCIEFYSLCIELCYRNVLSFDLIPNSSLHPLFLSIYSHSQQTDRQPDYLKVHWQSLCNRNEWTAQRTEMISLHFPITVTHHSPYRSRSE